MLQYFIFYITTLLEYFLLQRILDGYTYSYIRISFAKDSRDNSTKKIFMEHAFNDIIYITFSVSDGMTYNFLYTVSVHFPYFPHQTIL